MRRWLAAGAYGVEPFGCFHRAAAEAVGHRHHIRGRDRLRGISAFVYPPEDAQLT
jgi:hypothetical protein